MTRFLRSGAKVRTSIIPGHLDDVAYGPGSPRINLLKTPFVFVAPIGSKLFHPFVKTFTIGSEQL